MKLRNPFKKKQTEKNASFEAVTNDIRNNGSYIDMVSFVANKASDLLWGNGWDIRGDDTYGKRRLLDILGANGIDGLLRSSEQNLSKRIKGNQLWIVQPDNNRQLTINLADMDGSLLVGDQAGRILFARTSIQYYDGTYNWQVRQVWKAGKMKTSVNRIGANGQSKEMDLDVFNANFGTAYLREWNYGDLQPLIMFTNKTTSGIEDAGDGLPVRNLQNEIDIAYYMLSREMVTNSTKILVDKLPAEIKAGSTLSSDLINTLFINAGNKDNPTSIIQGNPAATNYLETITEHVNRYITGAGYSAKDDYNGTDTQVGVMFRGKEDRETTKIKKETREGNLKDLITSVISIDSAVNLDVYQEEEYVVVIQAFNVLEAGEADDRFNLLVELEQKTGQKLVSRRALIGHFYDIQDDDEEIDRIIAEIDRDREDMEVEDDNTTEDNTEA